jgi:exopolysaccharide production protein ExoZ
MIGLAGSVEHLQDGPTASRPTYRLIQVLRAIAAMMVVVHHATIMLNDRDGLHTGNWTNGAAGVDIFFVISGFVMTLSSAPLRNTLHPARTFLARRLERIVPLYWIITTVKVLSVVALPGLALNALGTPWHVIASYLFLPAGMDPVVVVGWTLNFELLFYLIFAVVLAVRGSLLMVLAPVLLVVPLLSYLPQPHVPTGLRVYESSMVFEFLFGVLLAMAVDWVRRWNIAVAVGFVTVGFTVFFHWGAPIALPWRGLDWGLPALAVVAGTIALEHRLGKFAPKWMLELGDASYSIYLVHGLVLPIIGILLAHAGGHWLHVVPVSILGMVLLSMVGGELVYRGVERPITQWFKGRRRTAIPANV